MTQGIVDVHHHILPPAYTAALGNSRVAGLSASGKLPDWSADRSIALMDKLGIDVAITSVSAPGVEMPTTAETIRLAQSCNDFSGQMMLDYPGRFGFFACLPLPDIAAAILETDRALDEIDADGVILLSNYGGRYLGDDAFDPLLKHLNDREAVAFVHPTSSGNPNCHPDVSASTLEFPFDTARTVASLLYARAFDRFPNIKFLFSHAGGVAPYLAWRMSALSQRSPGVQQKGPLDVFGSLSRQYFDTAVATNWPVCRLLLDIVPSTNILFGSDFPFVPGPAIEKAIPQIAGFDLPERTRNAIRKTNALALFPRFAAIDCTEGK